MCIRFADKQIVRLQETPDEIPEGGTPHTVSLLLHDKLVDNGKPGDRIEVNSVNFLYQDSTYLTIWFWLTIKTCYLDRSLEFTEQ